MEVENPPEKEEDFLQPEATLERLTDVLNEVLSIPIDEGLGAVARAQVERASAPGEEETEPGEDGAEAAPISADAEPQQDDGPSA